MEREIVMCAWCGSECGDDPYAFEEGTPFCSEVCFEAWAEAEGGE